MYKILKKPYNHYFKSTSLLILIICFITSIIAAFLYCTLSGVKIFSEPLFSIAPIIGVIVNFNLLVFWGVVFYKNKVLIIKTLWGVLFITILVIELFFYSKYSSLYLERSFGVSRIKGILPFIVFVITIKYIATLFTLTITISSLSIFRHRNISRLNSLIFISLGFLLLLYLFEQRVFIKVDQNTKTYITIWKLPRLFNSKCFIIPGKSYAIFPPKNNCLVLYDKWINLYYDSDTTFIFSYNNPFTDTPINNASKNYIDLSENMIFKENSSSDLLRITPDSLAAKERLLFNKIGLRYWFDITYNCRTNACIIPIRCCGLDSVSNSVSGNLFP